MAQPCESREGAAAAQSTLEGVGPSGRNRIIVHTEYMQMLSSLDEGRERLRTVAARAVAGEIELVQTRSARGVVGGRGARACRCRCRCR